MEVEDRLQEHQQAAALARHMSKAGRNFLADSCQFLQQNGLDAGAH